jgi:hypothetical protein
MLDSLRESFYDWMARNRFTPVAMWVIALSAILAAVALSFIPWSHHG